MKEQPKKPKRKVSLPKDGKANKSPSPKTLPTVPEKKATEERSRRRLKEVLDPWLVTDAQHDYGVDGFVEITRPHEGDKDYEATGKRFAFQLKASSQVKAPAKEAEVRVRPEHVRYWLASTEPVLLVFCHLKSRRIFWRWINDELVQQLSRKHPSWTISETVPIQVPEVNPEDEAQFQELEQYVRSYQGSVSKLLAPGTYTKLQKEVSQTAEKMLERIRQSEFESVILRLKSLHKALLSNTYMVAIAGPARAGKSTLMNTLLGIHVSPIGHLPTTAVTIMVLGADKNESEIFFEKGDPVVGPSTAEFIKQYATQEDNPENGKKVRHIVVRLINEMLERGVSYVDAPGLYDPSETIREVTAKALGAAHAILYVLDISPMSHGGFYLSQHHIGDLTRLSENNKHLFLVLNKSDVLSAEQRKQAEVYIESILRKYDIWNKLAHEPIFMSALDSLKWKESDGEGESPQKKLDDALWNFLLRTNNTGINRLFQSTTELKRACADLATLVNARRLSGAQAQELQLSLNKCRQRQEELITDVRQHISREVEQVRTELPVDRKWVIDQLNRWLLSIPINQEIPSSQDLQNNISKWLSSKSTNLWNSLEARSKNFAGHLSLEVEKALNQTRLSGGLTRNMRILLPPVPFLDLSKTESFEEAWAGLLLGALGFLASGPLGVILAIGGWFSGVVFGRENRRRRQINKIVKSTNTSLEGIYHSLQFQIEEKIGVYGKALEDQVNDRIGVFVADAEKQLSKLGAPISSEEQEEMESLEGEVKNIIVSLGEVEQQISPTGVVSQLT